MSLPEYADILGLPSPAAAPRLIGWELAAHGVRGRIVEAEAYQGEADRACHASRGRTERSAVLWSAPGTLYIYLVYGLHTLLNLVCDAEGRPAAVLIRSLEILAGEELARQRRGPAGRSRRELLANGPGKVTQVLALGVADNASRLGQPGCPLALLPPTRPPRKLAQGPRVGVAYAGPEWASKPWRWWEEGFPVSGVRP